MPLPDRVWQEHGQDLDHAGYADFVGCGEFKSLREIAVPQGATRRPSSGGWGHILATSRRPRRKTTSIIIRIISGIVTIIVIMIRSLFFPTQALNR